MPALTTAAFGRLCVETLIKVSNWLLIRAAAFGRLCVETRFKLLKSTLHSPAAFGRLCVETLPSFLISARDLQPPSGGCVLKHGCKLHRRYWCCQPPSGGCVLKHNYADMLIPSMIKQPPSGGCVLKQNVVDDVVRRFFSRLRAAVC